MLIVSIESIHFLSFDLVLCTYTDFSASDGVPRYWYSLSASCSIYSGQSVTVLDSLYWEFSVILLPVSVEMFMAKNQDKIYFDFL